MLKRTPLFARHEALGARMVDFGGWEMPVQYPTGILAEHAATRAAAGLFDTCHMGEFLLEADDVRAALNSCLAGDFRNLADGRERYSFITNDAGGVIDDCVAMIFSARKAWLVVNAGDIPGDFAAVSAHWPGRATDLSAATGKLDLQGPRAAEIVRTVTGTDFRALPFYSFIETAWRGTPLILSRSGYTGEPGVEFYLAAEKVGELWDELLGAGAEAGVKPCGLGARDTLRLEAGLPLYGHEMTTATDPLRAGFGKFVALEKPEDSPGKRALGAIAAQRAGDPQAPTLVGLRLDDLRVPRPGFAVLAAGQKVGEVTSGAPGPTVGASLALAYVPARLAAPDTGLEIDIRGRPAPARVVKPPFYANPALREIQKEK